MLTFLITLFQLFFFFSFKFGDVTFPSKTIGPHLPLPFSYLNICMSQFTTIPQRFFLKNSCPEIGLICHFMKVFCKWSIFLFTFWILFLIVEKVEVWNPRKRKRKKKRGIRNKKEGRPCGLQCPIGSPLLI